MFDFPEGKRYSSFVGYFRKTYGERLQKIVIDAGFTCPNRDGTVGRGGCTYCDNAAFHPAYSSAGKPIHDQIDEGIGFHKVRYRNASHYLAYFQSFSNTYAPLGRLRELYLEALSHPRVAGIVIGTRPDCVDEAKLDWLASLAEGSAMPGWSREVGGVVRKAPIVIVEYGIESCYDSTLVRINRGHGFACARRAVTMTAERGIGTALMEAVIQAAREAGQKTMVITSNHKLKAALRIYEKLGFQYVEYSDKWFQLSDIRMELEL